MSELSSLRGTVTYDGGEVVAFRVRPRDTVAAERYARRHGIPIGEGLILSPELALVIAHSALRIEEGLDVWLDNVDDVDVLTPGEDGYEAIGPFPEAQRRER